MKTYYTIRGREIPYAVILFFLVLPICAIGQNHPVSTNFEKYLQQARQDTFSFEARKRFLKIAYHSLKTTQADSVKYSRMSKIVEVSSNLQDSAFFYSTASEGLKLAEALENPALLGDAHWNYGSYYLRIQKYDSSYYHYNRAFSFFIAGDREYYAGKMLYNMAYIASETNDLTGAEILLFRSIDIFERTKHPQQEYRCYNILGNNADDMGEFEKSLIYYTKAAQLIPSFENAQYYQLENWNNLGVRLYKMGLFEEAITFFERALNYANVLGEKPALKAKLLDNRAFCMVSLREYQNVAQDMKYAMALRDSLEEAAGAVTSRLRFANYYGKTGDTLNGISFAEDALKLAKEHFLTRDVLDALAQLASLDKPNTVSYLQEHIELDKRLNARDRNLRNKFTAIQYETDKYIQENEKLFRQRLWILIVAISITTILILIYMNTRQRAKNKELLFEREQQQYNEDIFLMALEQKTTLERGRSQERLRISEELHDGILARLFAIRFKWSFIELSGNAKNLQQHKNSIALLTDIETEIRNISHDLRNELIWEELGFRNEIENTIKERSEIGNFQYTFSYSCGDQWEALDYLYKINICRMLDEILQNVIKHAKATEVAVSFSAENNTFIISVADDGKGFNKQFTKTGIGLKNLKNRVKKLNGELTLLTKVGAGTTVEIQFSRNV